MACCDYRDGHYVVQLSRRVVIKAFQVTMEYRMVHNDHREAQSSTEHQVTTIEASTGELDGYTKDPRLNCLKLEYSMSA